jgi:hypothetical protein
MEFMMSDKPSDDEIYQARGFGPPVPWEPAPWAAEVELKIAKHDLVDKLATAMDFAVAIGKFQGELRIKRSVVKIMLLQKYSVEDISRMTGFPADEVMRLGSDS